MATAAVTNTFVTATPALAAEVNTNFSNLVDFLNNSVIHKDGTKAMTSSFDAGSNKVINLAAGTSGTDAVNKTQLDGVVINTANIANDAVIGSKILDGQITASKIGDGNITTAKLASVSVTADKMALSNLTQAGNNVVSCTSGVSTYISYPIAYSSPPIITVSSADYSIGPFVATIWTRDAFQFAIYVFDTRTNAAYTGPFNVMWIAHSA